MKVQIEGNLYMESDAHNFILKEYTERKDGKGEGKTIIHGYFPTVSALVTRVVKMKVKESTAKTLQELVRDVQRIEEYVHSQLSV